MVAFNFQKQFVPMIQSGQKRHTIRIDRADGRPHAKKGDMLQLYTGMRTSACEKIIEEDVKCDRYEPVFITESNFFLNGAQLSMQEIDWLARNDGFANLMHMMSWLKNTHEFPFKGALIGWEPADDLGWYFHPLHQNTYGVILADPAWPFDVWGDTNPKDRPYDCMSLEDIAAMPVAGLAAKSCLLFMWTTWSHMGNATTIMRHWGFNVATGGAWFKWTKHGKEHFSTGHILRSGCCEPFLIGTRGKPVIADRGLRNTIQTFEEQNIISAKVREHSRKPDDVYEILERLWPGAFRCELFARQKRPGWAAWGNQSDMFSGGVK